MPSTMAHHLSNSKLSAAVKHSLNFRPYWGKRLTSRLFSTSQNSSFRSAANQQNHAGLARSPEPDYHPEDSKHNPSRSALHSPSSSKTSTQTVDADDIGAEENPSVLHRILGGKPAIPGPTTDPANVPIYHRGFVRVPYWQKIWRWRNITEEQFLSYRWGVSKSLMATNT